MTWSKRAVLAAALLVVGSGSARAQVTGHPYEFSGGAGIFAADTRAGFKDGVVYQLSAGIRINPWVAFEVPGLYVPTKSTIDPDVSHTFAYVGADLRWSLRPSENRVVPYVLTGAGYAQSKSDARDPQNASGGAGSLGMGMLYNWRSNPRLYLRFQVRDVLLRDRTVETANHFAATAAVHYVFGGKYRDQDLDGVRDWLDQCPNTPIGAQVDAHGCPTDTDRDSVWTGIDKCPDTPAGCKVDKNGCPIDSDGDGVCDGLDLCADTPQGATVDARGCPSDADADSVLDGIDKCPNTPRGAVVDATGCPKDSDGDGVPDGIDQCPGTKAGQGVDDKGCVLASVILENDLMDTGMIRLRNVAFEDGKSDVPGALQTQLDDVGKALAKFSTVKFEVASRTNELKKSKDSQKVAEARSKSVVSYLTGKYPELKKANLVPKGYGSARPAGATTANKTLEFRALDLGALKREIQKLRQPVTPPAPSTAPPDSTR